MESWGITNSGVVRSVNQDVYKIVMDEENGFAILVVCDGMGGANAGNVASELAAEVFTAYIIKNTSSLDDDVVLDDIADVVEDAADAANTAVYEKGQGNKNYSGMGTTLVSLVSTNLGEIVLNIGDSRAYHINQNGILQITKDHSVVEEMIDRGEITRREAEQHPRKNLITRAIGAEEAIAPDVYLQTIDSGDLVLLCTDGLTGLVSDSEILKEFRNNYELQDACEALVNLTLLRGAPDNITVAAFRK